MMMIVIMMMKSCLTNEACFHEALNVTAYADIVSVFLGYECVPWPEWPSIAKDLQLASLSCGASRCQVRSIHDSHNFYILYFNFFKFFYRFQMMAIGRSGLIILLHSTKAHLQYVKKIDSCFGTVRSRPTLSRAEGRTVRIDFWRLISIK